MVTIRKYDELSLLGNFKNNRIVSSKRPRSLDKDVSTGKKKLVNEKGIVCILYESYGSLQRFEDEDAANTFRDAMIPLLRSETQILTFASEEEYSSKKHSMEETRKQQDNIVKRKEDEFIETCKRLEQVQQDYNELKQTRQSDISRSDNKNDSAVVSPSPAKKPPIASPAENNNPLPTWEELDIKQETTSISTNNGRSKHALLKELLEHSVAGEGMEIVIHTFTDIPQTSKACVIMYDFIDTTKKTNTDVVHWCHRPFAWERIFKKDRELKMRGEKQCYSDWMHQHRACFIRASHLGNVKKQYTAGSKSKPYKLDLVSLYAIIEKGLTDKEIKERITSNWKAIVEDEDTQQLYHAVIVGTSASERLREETQPVDRKSVDPKKRTPQYWTRMQGCFNNIRVQNHSFLNEKFMDDDIKPILLLLFHGIISDENFTQPWRLPSEIQAFVGPEN